MRFLPNGKFLLVAAAAGVALSFANQPSAQAAGFEQSDLTVTASVSAACQITTVPLDFGGYDSLAVNAAGGADLMAGTPGEVRITCANGLPVNLTLDNGLNFGATRQMAGPAAGDLLAYELHTGAAANCAAGTPWPGAGVAAVGTGALDIHSVYGCVPRGQAPNAGAYSDTVVATVSF